MAVAHGLTLPGLWGFSASGMGPVSPALAGRFFATGPPGRPCNLLALVSSSRLSEKAVTGTNKIQMLMNEHRVFQR